MTDDARGGKPSALPVLHSRLILGTRTDSTSYTDAATRVLAWAGTPESRYVCVSNVHVTMEAYDSAEFRGVVSGAVLVTPDGMPLVWALRLLGVPEATRVYGPTLTVRVLERAAAAGMPVGLYGSSPEVLASMLDVCERRFAGLRVAYAHTPPFRELTAEEDLQLCARSVSRERESSSWGWAVPSRSGGWLPTRDT